MSYEFLLSVALVAAALVTMFAWRLTREPPLPPALPSRADRHAQVPSPSGWRSAPAAERFQAQPPHPPYPALSRVRSEAVLAAGRALPARVRAFPVGVASRQSGAVRLMIISTPRRPASLTSLDAAALSDATTSDVLTSDLVTSRAGEGRRR
jgi:hypothetical protein